MATKESTAINIIFKTFRADVKSVDKESGTIEMLIPVSTQSEDRSQEACSWDCWTKRLPIFMKRPVLVSSHDYGDLRKQIGEWVAMTPTQDGLLGKPKYYINEGNDEADWAFNIASKGMAAFSVGFIPYDFISGKKEGEPAIKYTDCELLEVSQVVVPCNRDAIQGQRSKSVDPVMTKLMDDVLADIDATKAKKAVSQDELRDELDFVLVLLKENTLNEANIKIANSVLAELRRIIGCDKPIDIEGKVIAPPITPTPPKPEPKPKELSQEEQERLFKEYLKKLLNNLEDKI